MQAAPKEVEKLPAEEMKEISPETIYTDLHIQSLESVGPISNSSLLEPLDAYMQDELSGEFPSPNQVLKQGLRLDADMLIVPEAVVSVLASKFKEDVRLPVQRNPKSENWQTNLSEKYLFQPYEDIKVLIMVHGEEESKI